MATLSPIDPLVGRAIRARRLARRESQVALAARAGVADATIRAVELGRTAPHRATLDAVARALGTTIDALIAEARNATRKP